MIKTFIPFLQNFFSYKIWPYLWVSVFLGVFYYFTAPMLWLDVRNANEAGLLWFDERLHLRSIERMQSQQTWELLHRAYTAFYTNLSYAVSWLINGSAETIPTGTFITGSRWTSYLCMQSIILVVFWRLFKLLGSWKWALLGMCFVGMQRGSYFFAITMHPEPPMLLGIVVSIFGATEYLRYPRFFNLFLMSLGIALAISSKLQSLLLLPWAGIIGLLGLWIRRINDLYTISLWMIGSLMTLVVSVLLLTPYQMFHWQRLWSGIQAERNVQLLAGDTYSEVNIFDWIDYTVSNELVGYSYSLLLLLTLFLFIRKYFQNIQNLRAWLGRPMPALFVTNLIWVVIGAGYVFVEVEVLIARYLIHVAPSLMLLTFIGVYWLSITPTKTYQYAWIALLVVLIIAGLQQQTKHASFDFRVRQHIVNRLVHIRQVIDELKSIIPRESNILNAHGLHIDSEWFFNVHTGDPTFQMLTQSKIEYLLIPESYAAGLRPEGTSLEGSQKSAAYREKINFWKALIENGINGQFQVLRQFPKARLTLYRRVIRD